MAITDPIADMLTRVRNACKAGHPDVLVPNSKLKEAIARVLKEEGYILDYTVLPDSKQNVLKMALKYDKDYVNVIEGLKRLSRPGRRMYRSADNLPKTMGGLGITIISTSSGIMTDADARRQGIGGELLCAVW